MQLDDPAALRFRARVAQRRREQRASVWWWVAAVVAALGFVLLVQALLARTAWTAGSSPPVQRASPVAQPVTPPVRDVEYLPTQTPMVYRCVDARGHVSLQSQACGPGQRTTRAVPAPPDREPPRRSLPQPRAAMPAPNVVWSGPSEHEHQRAAARLRCESAKEHRERTLKIVGLRRTFDLLRQLDDSVREACKDA